MGVIEFNGVDAYNAFKVWQKDYQKANDKDMYIHRLEDLFEKNNAYCESLQSRIKELEAELFLLKNSETTLDFSGTQLEILREIAMEPKRRPYLDNWVNERGIKFKLAFKELEKANYIFINSSNQNAICEEKEIEVLNKLRKSMEDDEAFEVMRNLNCNF